MMIFKTVELLERREGARSCLDDTCQCFLLAKNVLVCSEDLVKDPSTDKGNAYEICRYKSSNQVIDTPEGNQRIHVSSSSKSAVSEGGMARPQRCQVRCMGPWSAPAWGFCRPRSERILFSQPASVTFLKSTNHLFM